MPSIFVNPLQSHKGPSQSPLFLDLLAGQQSTGEPSWESLLRKGNTTDDPPSGRGKLRVAKTNFSFLTKMLGGSAQFSGTDKTQNYHQ